MIQEAHKSGSRIEVACNEAGLPLRSYRRWFKEGAVTKDRRPFVEHPEPSNKLSEAEIANILEICNWPEFSNLPPSQIVPALLDRNEYYASESTFYRVLKANKQLSHRGRAQVAQRRSKPNSYTATGPNQVWTWDISYLPSRVKGQFFYLYLFEDIYSRKLVGYEVHEQECGTKAAELMQRNVLKEQCLKSGLVLHSDNGAPMKSFTMKAKLEELGVESSYNRPRVSNDNPYSESTFRTLKYRPNWPSSGFETLTEAQNWVQHFVNWYNNEHKHSKINFVTPSERHDGRDQQILANRKRVLEIKKAQKPERWSKDVRNCEPAGDVMLNPDQPKKADDENVKVAA